MFNVGLWFYCSLHKLYILKDIGEDDHVNQDVTKAAKIQIISLFSTPQQNDYDAVWNTTENLSWQ